MPPKTVYRGITLVYQGRGLWSFNECGISLSARACSLLHDAITQARKEKAIYIPPKRRVAK